MKKANWHSSLHITINIFYRKFTFPVILSVLDIHQFQSHTTRVADIGDNLPVPLP